MTEQKRQPVAEPLDVDMVLSEYQQIPADVRKIMAAQLNGKVRKNQEQLFRQAMTKFQQDILLVGVELAISGLRISPLSDMLTNR